MHFTAMIPYNAIMQPTQIRRALKAIERERAEMAAEIARMDRAADALRDLLPMELKGSPSTNGSAAVTVEPKPSEFGKRRRGMKGHIAGILKGNPNRVFTVAELRRRLDDVNLINPAAQNPEKMIGTALRRLRADDPQFIGVGRGKYMYAERGP